MESKKIRYVDETCYKSIPCCGCERMENCTLYKETPEEKENRIFNHYKNDLIKLYKQYGSIRFNVIQYVCSFPKIDPFRMAHTLMMGNYNVVFDDSSITKKENEKLKKQVLNYKEGWK